MFGLNPIAKLETLPKLDGWGHPMLRVVASSPFYTIQGEGPFSGNAAVFIRLHGCPLRCFFCDTQFSDEGDPWVGVSTLVDVVEALAPDHCRLVVITGGEPLRQDLTLFIEVLTGNGFHVQIETAGVFWQECLRNPMVTVVCSPKTPAIHLGIYDHATAFKYVLQHGSVSVEDGLPILSTQRAGELAPVCRPRPGAPVYVTPMDEYYEPTEGNSPVGRNTVANALNKALVAKVCMDFGYFAGVQLHKELGDLP